MRVAVILVTVLAVAQADWFWGSCPDAQLQENFDPSKYTGTWYGISQSKNLPYPATFRCTTAHYELNEDGTVAVYNQTLRDGKYSGRPAVATFKPGTAEGYVKFGFLLGGSYNVLETDYTSYTKIWGCNNYAGIFNTQYGYILARTPDYEPDTDWFDSFSSETDLKLDTFAEVNQQDCPPRPN